MLKRNLAFIGLCLGFFIIMMDTTTVPLTYTTLMRAFSIGPNYAAFVNNIYLITYAATLLIGGRLGDSLNRKYLLLVAFLFLGLGALVAGCASSFSGVLIGRALMGVGAGLLTPQSMAYISTLFTAGSRGFAFGLWGAVAGVATAAGPAVAQLFLAFLTWRWVMWVNVPIVLVCLLLTFLYLPDEGKLNINLKSFIVSSFFGLMLALAILGIQLLSFHELRLGWALLIFGLLIAAIWFRKDLRSGNHFILPQMLWCSADFKKVCMVSGILGGSLTAFYFPLIFILDVKMLLSPVAISIAMLLLALSGAVVGPFAGRLSDRVNARKLIAFGLCLFAIGSCLLGISALFLVGNVTSFIGLCCLMLCIGSGAGIAFAPLANAMVKTTHGQNVAQAAAFYNMVRQMFSAASAVFVSLIFSKVVEYKVGHSTALSLATLFKIPKVVGFASFISYLIFFIVLVVGVYLIRSCEKADISSEGGA